MSTVSARKTIMLTTLALFLFIGVIMIYLVFTDGFDDGQILDLSNVQIIMENTTTNNIIQPSNLIDSTTNIIPKIPIIATTSPPTTNTKIMQTIANKVTTSSTKPNIDIQITNTEQQETLTSIAPTTTNTATTDTMTTTTNINTSYFHNNTINIPITTNSTATTIDSINKHQTDDNEETYTSKQQSDDIFPSSWKDLNEQQFCSVHSNTAQQKLMEYIYHQQFNKDCNDPSIKFLIYDIALETTRGLGASLYGYLCRYMTVAIQTNRTFLIDGLFDWTKDKSYCANTNAMECYFLPLSNCNPIDILSKINRSDPSEYHEGGNPTNCIFGANDRYENLTDCTQKVIYINKKKTGKPMLQRAINWFAQKHFNMKIFEFESILVAFFLRPQPMVRQIIYDKIYKSINKSLNGDIDRLDASHYISLPIRASDKCNNINKITHKHYTHRPETTCFTPLEYVLLMNVMRYYANHTLKGVIMTSEDASFIKDVMDIMKYDNRSNVSDWNVILNTEDYSVGEGTTTYKLTKKVYNTSLRSNIGTSLYTDHIISALSSLILQIHLESDYLIWLYESSWTELMWNWLAVLNCNIKKEKHIINYNKCVKLLTSGYIHHRDHNKVEFSKDIYNKIQNQHLNYQQFYDKFGIWYENRSYCHIEGSKHRVAK